MSRFDDWEPPLPDAELSVEEYRMFLAKQVCRVCKQRRTSQGHDPCLGHLPGVDFACCGHGREGYVSIDGKVIRGKFDHLAYEEGDA